MVHGTRPVAAYSLQRNRTHLGFVVSFRSQVHCLELRTLQAGRFPWLESPHRAHETSNPKPMVKRGEDQQLS